MVQKKPVLLDVRKKCAITAKNALNIAAFNTFVDLFIIVNRCFDVLPDTERLKIFTRSGDNRVDTDGSSGVPKNRIFFRWQADSLNHSQRWCCHLLQF